MGNRGFTLTEVLVAVTIIGILSAASVVYYGTTVQRSRWDAAQQVLQTIYDGEQAYFALNNTYAFGFTCATALDVAPPAISWRRSLNMDNPCPGASPPVTYGIAGTATTFTATATSNSQTQTINDTRTPSGTWTRP